MRNEHKGNVGTIVRNGKLIDAALAAGVRDTLRRHLQAGQPVVEWQDGKILWLGPAEIEKRIREIDKNRRSQ